MLFMKPFLLRFQERTVQEIAPDGMCRPSAAQELADADDRGCAIVAGTKTITEVRQEGLDSDPEASSFSVFPKHHTTS